MKKITVYVSSAFIALSLMLCTLSIPAAAQISSGAGSAKGTGVAEDISPGKVVTQAVNVLLWAVGIIAVIMLIWGGIKYITSAGDANKVTSAKNTILYSVIGLVVAIFAYAIVSFVNTDVKNAASPPLTDVKNAASPPLDD